MSWQEISSDESAERLGQDRAVRAEVLDPERSFIVQAPAGSGKTELLTQRILGLLQGVGSPEEILAITFTRKAAGEMRERLLRALQQAAHEPSPEKGTHHARTWELARGALEQDRQQGWNLLSNPGRLEIRTMDSLNARLVRQMPVMAAFGGISGISDDAEEAFAGAARRTIGRLEEAAGAPLVQLLEWLDNDLSQLERLLTEMLGHRDQWLSHVVRGSSGLVDRDSLERTLRDSVEESLQHALKGVKGALGEEGVQQLVELAAGAAEVAAESPKQPPVIACAGMESLPSADADALPLWQGIASLFLKSGGGFRRSERSWNRHDGFPAGAEGKRLKAVIHSLVERVEHHHEAAAAIQQIPLLPPISYEDGQWETILSLFQVLLMAQLELMVWFEEHGVVDHAEIAQRALQALGSELEPTNLALRLDHQIHHILVDEFQDTSHGQFDLLRRLIAGWSGEEGARSLFLVGDPMQSIYRFRHAEVGLFIKAIREGIGQQQLEYRKLSANFRSEEGVVEWINRSFSAIFPPYSDRFTGAIRYRDSISTRAGTTQQAVTLHPALQEDGEEEAARVVALVREELRALTAEDERIAILVRSRSHLTRITQRLYREGIAYHAVEIESLGDRPVVRDLLSLTRALLHPADREAWLAVLRAPWCGIPLEDLLHLTADGAGRTLWSLMGDSLSLERVSRDGQQRIGWLRSELESILEERGEGRLDQWLKRAWRRLGGAAIHEQLGEAGQAELEADSFFDLLQQMEQGGDLVDLHRLRHQLQRQNVRSVADPACRLEVMTIHKSKGLQFDTVILPGLGRKPRQDQQQLLHWLEIPQSDGDGEESMQLLLSPIRQAERASSEDRLGRYVRSVEQARGRSELSRLLYVATTRAKRRLHLLGAVRINSKGELGRPWAGSLLEQLWPVVEGEYRALFEESDPEALSQQSRSQGGGAQPLRLTELWQLPDPPDSLPLPDGRQDLDRSIYQWSGASAIHVGTVVHALLQWIAEEGVEQWVGVSLEPLRQRAGRQLRQLGVDSGILAAATERVLAAVQGVLDDPAGRYFLADHAEAASEWSLSAEYRGERINITIDRTFVDEKGVRWIVDWKSSSHGGGDLEGFLDEEVARYTPQLQRYGEVLRQMEARPQRLVLYFPLLQVQREITPL